MGRKWLRRGALALCGLLAAALVLDQLFPPPIDRGRIVSTVVTDREGRALRVFPVEDGRWRLAAELEDIDPTFLRALIAIEDKRFYDHPGVDGLAVLRAVRDAIAQGEITSGASTITMQTARLLEPRPRTIGSKIIEMIRAAQLETRLSKDEILELYLTLAPYGGNLEGVRAASWAYFGREPQALAPDQVALLLALPQAPEARRPDRREAAARAARQRLLTRMTSLDLLAEDRAQDAAEETLPTRRRAFPAIAWHAADTIRQDDESPGATRASTIDRTLQRETEALIRQLAEESGSGVQAAALIIERDGRAVRAAVGSAGRHRAGGWIDLTDRRRSPGSTLKPLIYGMAFDDGIAAPGTLMNDLPARFATYRPENFDRTFRGEVTVAQALQHSLNVPAVHVLDALGANRFVAALDFAGSSPLLPATEDVDAGLAIALGGLGLRVRDLAVLYAALADGGRALPLAWTPDAVTANRQAAGHPLMSEESAEEIVGILAGSPAPPGRIPSHLTTSAPRVAYKTGTSYGFRDAWAAGISGNYIIVVWVWSAGWRAATRHHWPRGRLTGAI